MSREIKIAGYSDLKKIGQGGMGRVYSAVQNSVNRTVALKTLEQSLLLDEDSARRMVREAQISARLLHENIVKIYDAGESDGLYFISMELLPGGDLSALVNKGLLPSVAVGYVAELAGALDYAHQQGFVHRDIKPENIMLRGDGTPVITDFGVARPIDSRTNLTITGAIVGTPQFMSPEQTKGLPVDGRSDLYSLASVLFYMITGEALFVADSVLALTYQQVNRPIPKLLAPYHKLQWFFEKALAKHPEDRYQSGADMKLGLEKFHRQLLKLPQQKVTFKRALPGEAKRYRSLSFITHGIPVLSVLLTVGAVAWYVFIYQKPSTNKDLEMTVAAEQTAPEALPDVVENVAGNEFVAKSESAVIPADNEHQQNELSEPANIALAKEPSLPASNQLSELQAKVAAILADSRIILEESLLTHYQVQQIVSKVLAAKALSPESKAAAEILDELAAKLLNRFNRSISDRQFSVAEQQLAALALVLSPEAMSDLRSELRQSRQQYARLQKEQQQAARIRQLIKNADIPLASNDMNSLPGLYDIYSEILTLDNNNREGLQLQSDYQKRISVHIEQALSDQRFEDAELWTNQLANEPLASAQAAIYQKEIGEGRRQQQAQIQKAQLIAKEAADLKQSITELLTGALLSQERISQAEANLVRLSALDTSPETKRAMDRQFANAYQRLAERLLSDKNYEQALAVVEGALLRSPSEPNLLATKEQIQKAQQKRRRNITSF